MASKRVPKRDKLRDFLSDISREALATWLLASAKESPDLKRRLELFAAQHSTPLEAIQAYRALIKGAAKCRNRNPRKRARELSLNFLQLHAALQTDFEQGKLEVAVEILPEVLVAFDFVRSGNSDPNQQFAEIQAKLEALFLQAATELRPHPKRLAERIHDAQAGSRLNVLPDAAYQFRDVLGDLGLEHYRELLEPERERQIERLAASKARPYDGALETLKAQMLSWARAIEPRQASLREQAAVLESLGDSAQDFLEGVALYQRAGEAERALQLAGMSFEMLIGRKTPLSGFAEVAALRIQLLREAGQAAEALATAWRAYQALPGGATFLQLLHVVHPKSAIGAWRQQAESLALARSPDLFVEILLAEDRIVEARTFGSQIGLTSSGWTTLAQYLAKHSPEEAIPVLVQIAVREAENYTWGHQETVLGLFQQAYNLAKTPKLQAIFAKNLEEFRARYKAKTSLVRKLIF